jgi:hypothetical protein
LVVRAGKEVEQSSSGERGREGTKKLPPPPYTPPGYTARL